MKINLRKLVLTNFKGIKNLEINLNHITDIFGENAAGKTTVFDAFTWLFFGKDSTDRKDFELKPIDKNGRVSEKVDVEVSAIIEVDGKSIEVRKVLHEKWVKKRGDLIPEFQGNENLYYWNDVPVQLKQYQEKITEMINEHVFKLITNPLFFNSLKWQDRREVLLDIGGVISSEEMLAKNPDFKNIIDMMDDRKKKEFKAMIAAKKKKINDDLKAIPTRIDEITHNLPEAADFPALRKSVAAKEKEINEIDTALQDASKVMQSAFDAKRKQQNDLHELKTKAANLKSEIRSKFANDHNTRKEKIASLQSDIRLKQAVLETKAAEIDSKKLQIKGLQTNILNFNSEISILREEWVAENKKQLTFDEDKFTCPTCERPLEEDTIEDKKAKLTANFNTDKAKKLDAILSKVEAVKLNISKSEARLTELKSSLTNEEDQSDEIAPLNKQLDTLIEDHNTITANSESEFNKELETNQAYVNVLDEIATMEAMVSEDVKAEDNSELKEKKAALRIEVDTINRELNNEEIIKKAIIRRTELEEEESNLAQQLADLEGSEYLAEQFTKAKMDTLVQRINGRFKYVTFKMFDTLINGGEVECCETLVNGVPFQDANNAAKINAGLDIINTLCEHYNVYAPIFIDNRESVSELIDCNSQIVNLIVSSADKKLRVA